MNCALLTVATEALHVHKNHEKIEYPPKWERSRMEQNGGCLNQKKLVEKYYLTLSK